MNPSPSSQSVGAQKPSTAASTASGKRTRTIIVARNLPDPAISSSTTSTPSPSQSRFAEVGLLQPSGSRDGKSTTVKLHSYAALGNDTDVELYERFLSEKKAGPTRASQSDAVPTLDGNAPSPVFLKGSPKRRTTDQLCTHPGNATGGGPAALLDDTAIDAKQRRDAVVQHRKWLKSLPIHERLAYERQQNVRTKWKRINRQWEEFKQRTSKKLGKSEKQLVMSRASEYREQIEQLDALQRAMPLSEKVAGDFWLVSLRNEGTRYVPVGNIFSGLYCPIRESTKLQTRVRRPLDYMDTVSPGQVDKQDEAGQSHGKALSIMEKRSREGLERKKRRLKKQLEALYPHEVEPSQSGQLRVDTLDLFEWAAKGRDRDMRANPQSASTRSLLLSLEEEEQENDVDASNSHRSTARSQHSVRRRGPSLRVFSQKTIQDEAEDASDATRQQCADLTFFGDVGVLQHNTLCIQNNGTTALQFQWRREDLVLEDLASRLTHHDTSPLSEPARIVTTSISQCKGVLLPDEVLEFVFSFHSHRAGVWLERWVLDVDPPMLCRSTSEPAAVVHVQATAVDNFVPSSQRRKFHAQATAAETQFMAEQVLKQDVIQRVDPRYEVVFVDLSEQARLFYDTHRRGEFGSVQFSVKLLDQCHGLYTEALAVLTPPVIEIEEVVSSPSDLASAHDPMAEPEVSTLLPSYPRDWDLKLESLKDVAIEADAKLRTDYTTLKTDMLAERGTHDEDDDENDDDEEANLMEKVLGTKALKQSAEQAALRALEPHFVEEFRSITFAAHVSPYEPRLLSEKLSSNLASMASEAAVVVEIAQMMATAVTEKHDAFGLLRPLLVRALDESLLVDRERERVFEDAKRFFHSVHLSDKTDFTAIPRLLADAPTVPDNGTPPVIFFQVDLDIANWFTLSSVDPNGPLEWKLAQKLLDHGTHVPPKIAAASTSIRHLLEIATVGGRAPTVVLLSELTTPPMTKAAKRMEIAIAKVRAATTAAAGAEDASTAALTLAEVETMRQTLAAKRDKQLSLRGVEVILQRALAISGSHVPSVEFLSSLHELEAMYKSLSSRPATPADDGDGTPEAQKPRVILLDHLGTLSHQALKKPQEMAATKVAATPAAPSTEKAKPAAANDKKKKSTAAAPSTQAAKAASPTPVNDPSADDGIDTIEVLPGMSLEMMAAQALGQRLAQVGRFLVVDFFPRSWWEATFVYFAAAQSPTILIPGDGASTEKFPPPPSYLLVGPRLADTFTSWRSLFQPSLNGEELTRLVPMRAVVGGRSLERKLRLIDGLLERVDTIYFVGELAATIYRVLYTKQLIKRSQRERKLVPRYETQRLVAAVERLMQKAYRKQVELLLPFDFVVGESSLELEGTTPTADDDDGEEEDDEPEEDEDDNDDDDDGDIHKKKAKKKAAPQTPLEEPPVVDTWQSRPNYDSERGVVEMNSGSWIHFAEVTLDLVAAANVIDGKNSLLESAEAETEDPQLSLSPTTQRVPELDWMMRIFDVGPKSTQILLEDLRMLHDDNSGWVFLNGTLGVVEYRDFDAATRQLVNSLQTTGAQKSMLVSGRSTCRWLELLGWVDAKRAASYQTVVSSRVAKFEAVLSYVVESKPHAMLTAFDCV